MKPKVRLPIYQTKVWTIPLYWFPPQAGGVRDSGEGPARGEEEEFGALNPALDDILMRRNAGRFLEETREVEGAQRRDRRKFREREILGEVLFDIGADASERRPIQTNSSWEGGQLRR